MPGNRRALGSCKIYKIRIFGRENSRLPIRKNHNGQTLPIIRAGVKSCVFAKALPKRSRAARGWTFWHFLVYHCPLRRTAMNKSFVIASLIAAAALAACGKKEEPAPAPAPAPVEAPAPVVVAPPAAEPAVAAPAAEAASAAMPQVGDADKAAADGAATAAASAAK